LIGQSSLHPISLTFKFMYDIFRYELSQILNNQVLRVARNVFLDIIFNALDIIAMLGDLLIEIHDFIAVLDKKLIKFFFRDLFLLKSLERDYQLL
jgi:hypothetical protein